jgi:uncharacterized protein YjhX (UPF0386 family)
MGSTPWYQTLTNLQLHGLVAKGQIQCQQDGDQSVTEIACLARTGAMKMTPIAAMQVLLRLTLLHVIIEVEAHTWYYRIMCAQ